MRTNAGRLSALSLGCLLFGAACWGACGPTRADSSISKLYSRDAPAGVSPADRESLHQGAFVVAPDRALVTVTVSASAKALQEALAMAMKEAAAVAAAVKSAPGCSARTSDVDLPRANGGESYLAGAEVFVDVDLKGLTTVDERAARVAACLGGLDERARRAGKNDALSVRVSAPLLTVDDANQHLPALLKRAAGTLQATRVEGTAPPLTPAEHRCVPTGVVVVTSRRLSGLALEPALECRVERAAGG